MTSALPIDDSARLRKRGAERGPRLRLSRARTRVELGPGMTLGMKYVLLREIGKGAVGAVYEAENTWTGRHVAIKVLRVEYVCAPHTISRFWHEARLASSLRHPNIVDVIDMGFDEANNAPYIVEELLDGEGFDAALARAPSRRVAPEEALRVIVPVMDALAACHEVGIVHRDVKPSNILLCRSPKGPSVPKLIDFGVSKSLHTGRESPGMLFGTPRYMSPEQARGEPDIDARSDVWAVGVTLFEALTGRCPFERTPQLSVLAQVQRAAPPRVRDVAPDVPVDLANVVDRALRTSRDERLPSMRAFVEALLACESARGLPPRKTSSEPAPQPPEASDKALAALPTIPMTRSPRATPATPVDARPRIARSVFAPALAWVPDLLLVLLVVAFTLQPHGARRTAEAAHEAPAPTPPVTQVAPAPRAPTDDRTEVREASEPVALTVAGVQEDAASRPAPAYERARRPTTASSRSVARPAAPPPRVASTPAVYIPRPQRYALFE